MAEDLYHTPAIPTPSISKLKEICKKYGVDELPEQDLKDYQDFVRDVLTSYTTLYKYPEPALPAKYPRTPGYRPPREENKHNAWYYKTDIKGAREGKLSGKTIAIKDSIPVAGVPMMNGTTLVEGYTPEFDATVVTRILDAGGNITGKAVCEAFCFSASSFTSSTGPVLNPTSLAHSAGGSSCGSAALVAAGEVDMAIGADQGGSIRMPSSWCGTVGLKPTWGLVPYTGIGQLEYSVDHVGPMAATVQDCALLLEVIAGYDGGLDPRQPRDYQPPAYTEQLTGDLSGIKVGLVEEGFLDAQTDVVAMVKEAAQKMTQVGAVVEDVSIPIHSDGLAIWTPVVNEGALNNMVEAGGTSVGRKGHHPTSLVGASDRAFKTSSNDLPPTYLATILCADYVKQCYGAKHYARAQNTGRLLTAAYDRAFMDYDVLVMPTIKFKATKLPKGDPSVKEYLNLTLTCEANTAPFDMTGHPALSINAGFSEGLPVGMMIVGKQWEDATVLKVAHAFEQLRDAK